MVSAKSAFSDLLHLFFPHNCTGCGSDILGDDHLLCLHCLSQLPSTNFFDHPGNPVETTFYGRLPIRNGAAGYFFTKESLIQNLIAQLKYRGNKEVGYYLGKLLGTMITKSERYLDVDVMVPLPLNQRRQKKRGYNQAAAICKGIADVWNKPVMEDNVYRKVYTETQTHKGRISRWENMDGVFAIKDPAALQGKHILLVDDVVTTGATLEACGSEILKIPTTTLSIATLAYTIQ
jgi:ComF family protein